MQQGMCSIKVKNDPTSFLKNHKIEKLYVYLLKIQVKTSLFPFHSGVSDLFNVKLLSISCKK